MKNRIACVWVPDFSLAAKIRLDPSLKAKAVIIWENQGPLARVIAATEEAGRSKIAAGLSVAQACSLVPQVVVAPRDVIAERSAQESLFEVIDSCSPIVEEREGGLFFADITGNKDEKSLGLDLINRTEKQGLAVRIGIASTRSAAWSAAKLCDGAPVIVADGEEGSFLAPLPISWLEPSELLEWTLERWGIHTIGDFARLPMEEVPSRLGEPGRELHRRARGQDDRPLVPRPFGVSFIEGLSFDWAISQLDALLANLAPAVERLAQRLSARALGCRRLELGFQLEPEGREVRLIPMAAPAREAKTLLSLIRLELETRPPKAPVTGCLLAADTDRTRSEQMSLFGSASHSPDQIATMLARLSALVGPDRVGSPKLQDGHRPERFAVKPYAPPPFDPLAARSTATQAPPRRGTRTAVRVLRPGVELEVVAAGARPQAVRSLEDDLPLLGWIRTASGPWTVEEGWWSPAPMRRDYWDVELSDGGVYRIYQEPMKMKWFIDGVYD